MFQSGFSGFLASVLLLAILSGCTRQQEIGVDALLAEAEHFLSQEMYEQAESTLVVYQDVSSLPAKGHVLKGQAQVGLFNDEGAIQSFKAALSMDAENLDARLQLVRALRRSGLLDEAFAEIERISSDAIPPFLYEAGQIRMQQGRFEEAIPHFERVLEIDPSYVEGYYALGTAFQRVGRLEEGEEMLARYQALHNTAEDVKLDAQIVELNPESADAHYNLARAYEQQGETQLAIAYYQKAIELDGQMREAYNNLGIVLFSINEDEQAAQAFQQAIALSDTTAKYYFNLGAVYARRGILEEAEKLWRKTLELDPNYERAREFLEQIERAGS